MGVEDHLLRLARVSPHKQHARVAEPDVGNLHDHRRAVDQHDLVAPVELVGLARREGQRDIGVDRRLRPSTPGTGVAAHRVVPALVAERAQGLEHPDQGQPLTRRLRLVGSQQPIQLRLPAPQLRQRLDLARVGELGGTRAQHFAHRVARDVQLPDDLLDRLAPHEKLAPDPRNRVHALHPPTTRSKTRAGSPREPRRRGSKLDADPPAQTHLRQ